MSSTVVVNHGFDETGHERKERHSGLARCPGCDAEIGLVEETEEWVQGDDGLWRHNAYGPAVGVCNTCNILIADTFDGCAAYKLGKPKP